MTAPSVGQQFASAVSDGQTKLDLPVSLPTTFTLFAHRPRYTVRHLLTTAPADTAPWPYVTEAIGDVTSAKDRYAQTPEAHFAARLTHAGLAEVSAEVPLPDGLDREPAVLAWFVDRRVVVRLCTIENEVLLHGNRSGTIGGLLRLPGLRRAHSKRSLGEAAVDHAARVEEMGGSCDGIVVHPIHYWEMVHSGLLNRLGEAGVRVSRTRMISSNLMLLGDFRAAATLVDPARSTLALEHSPEGRALVRATVEIGLAVHLPQHLLLVEWE